MKIILPMKQIIWMVRLNKNRIKHIWRTQMYNCKLVKFAAFLLLSTSILYSQGFKENGKNNLLDRLIGTWATKSISRSTTDGTWKTDTTTASWVWYKILQDKAIQDDWYANTTPDKLEEATSMGTNIRIYNEKEKKWYMGWIDTFNYKLQTFTATEENGVLTMEGNNAQGRPVRIVFSNVTENSFDWAQQWTFDEGKTWVDVSKIWGKRWEN